MIRLIIRYFITATRLVTYKILPLATLATCALQAYPGNHVDKYHPCLGSELPEERLVRVRLLKLRQINKPASCSLTGAEVQFLKPLYFIGGTNDIIRNDNTSVFAYALLIYY